MKKLLGAVITAAALLLVGCGESKKPEAEATADPININMSLVFTQNELLTKELIKATDKIRERTDGSVNIKVFPGGQLPVYKDNLEQVVNGANWIAVEDLTYLGDYVPDFAALAGPMLYNTYDEYLAMMDTEFVAGLKAKAEEKGIKVLNADYMFGFRHMITNKEIVNSADMKGMRIRVPQSQLFISTLSAMGAAPASLPFPETYAGVQQGVVDGLEGSILTMYSTKIYEVAKNMSLTKHFLGTVGIYISPKLWDKFTPEQQQIINEELEAGAISNTSELVKLDTEYTQKLEELGVTFNEVNSEEFNQLTADVYNQFPEWSEGIHAKIMQELETIRAAQ
ncbi:MULTISPECIES: C4-dicarboxylate TRAP transporter substrate-binding protein [Vibrio]|uniref:C4-dicarboxylate TRAP transporter substrate-binding protein n=1 Tax=Vibrio TaxID=662 RepID=UPI0001B95865|nr:MULTISPECIES: C4-dicarboxylate TRAP transporter substrate-binding protein [Vibrio]EEX32881.1 C4-dicarboxylate-binding protein [Vibrio coralliilyticus ATCC BAA-450]MCG9681542.1 C4-dicarboxylate TRAP transporter substrate-binding protein [Vibrio sp. Isolate23]MCM5507614.1 C4-dicarboxylate TRAP transporter substrate-binding protein [Vibrio sp. SCSIO 43169]MDE3899500.1 C4-dicarboxylate TRAP transporter substrate-binding protein [Vibrio sp. CC007]NOH60366.1 C4-dicarboxylate ABC transporter [Vibr